MLHPGIDSANSKWQMANREHSFGHPPTTWIKTINKDLKEIDENLSLVSNESILTLETLCADRKKYRDLMNTVCLLEDGADKETGDEY